MDFLQRIAGTVSTALAALGVITGGVWWWQAEASARSAVGLFLGKGAAWGVVVLLVPWATFWVIGAVARRAESNAAGAVLVGAYTAVEVGALAWLFWGGLGEAGNSGLAWAAFVAAGLFAGVYNLFACDWIAEKAS